MTARFGLFLLLPFLLAASGHDNPVAPMARKTPKEIMLHGHKRIDEYAWIRDRKDPEVIKYLEAENAHTAAAMKDTEDFQKKLYDEMLGRIQETDLSVPYRDGDYFYYSRTEKGKQYPLLARKLGSLEAPEQVYLDLNVLAEGKSYFRLGALALSPDHQKVAYSSDTDGSEVHTTYVKDLKTGELLADRITRTAALVWANDNKTLFYTTIDEAKRAYRFYRHELGAAPAGDELLFEEKDELYNISAERTKSDGYILLNSASSTTTEVRYLPAARPREALRIVHPREKDHRYEVDHHGQLFYIVTNSGAKDFRLMTAPVDKPQKKRWKEVLPARQGVKLDRVELFKDTLVAVERQNGLPRLRVVDLKSGNFHYIEFPESAYSASVFNNLVWDTDLLRFNYASLVTPSSVYDYSLKTRDRVLLKRQPVLGGYDPALYQAERISATAADGTKIPVSIVYKKGTPLDGSAPLWLNGYGSYGSSMPVTFNSNRLSLLDRGVIVALAHIRGGGDLGEEWHESGKLMNKKNTFTDFVAVAEHLIAKMYTRSDRLVIQGGSAGGLLIGATLNLRPDLFRAAIANVPFVDVMNTMLDATLPLTVGEYLEWGNPNEKAAYEYMASYDPYSNIKAQRYPAVLITAGLNDPRVGYWEGAKFAAKLRATKTDDNVLLLKTNLGAGHSGSSGRYDRLKEIAFEYAFLLKQIGRAEPRTQ